MKTPVQRLRERLRMPLPHPTVEVSIRMPQCALDDMIEIAPMLGCLSYRGVIKRYISQGLREDLLELVGSPQAALVERLRSEGISDDEIASSVTGTQPYPIIVR